MTKHLLTVWNPSYAADAMDAHLHLLLDWSQRTGKGQAKEEDVYVWWGKVRSPNRRQPLPHLADIQALNDQVAAGVETHLYLTDYRSLYVGWVDDIAGEELLRESDEADHMPGYYQGLMLDLWFKLLDIRRLVANDTPATIEELKHLRNTRYYDRPVSLYGGIVELPLIVTRDPAAPPTTWFSDMGLLTGGRLWAERDAELRGETERVARELRDNLIGRSVWALLEPASTAFLASAEAVYRSHRDDPGFDFSSCAVEYAKAVETELNAVVFRPLQRRLAKSPPAERLVYPDGHRHDLGAGVPHQALGTVQHLLEDAVVQKGIKAVYPNAADWLLRELPSHLGPLVSLRNPAAHSAALSCDAVARQREAVLGIGCEGLIVRLARVKGRAVM